MPVYFWICKMRGRTKEGFGMLLFDRWVLVWALVPFPLQSEQEGQSSRRGGDSEQFTCAVAALSLHPSKDSMVPHAVTQMRSGVHQLGRCMVIPWIHRLLSMKKLSQEGGSGQEALPARPSGAGLHEGLLAAERIGQCPSIRLWELWSWGWRWTTGPEPCGSRSPQGCQLLMLARTFSKSHQEWQSTWCHPLPGDGGFPRH